MDTIKERLKLIKKIQRTTNSVVISLVYNTTPTRFRTQLASDMLISFNSLLKSIPKHKKERVILFLHSSGGFLDVISSFVYMIRKRFNEFYIVIPEVAHSAATILSFGADKILMSHYSSLSPVDPQIGLKTPGGNIGASTEDIQGYYLLIKELFKDDMAKIGAFNLLASRFPPEVLGKIERVQKQTEMIARNMLSYQKLSNIDSVVNKFQKEFFSHDHRIHFDDAKNLGLKVELIDENLENICSKLLSFYMQSFGSQSDLEVVIPEGQNFTEIVLDRSYLECQYSSFSYKTKYRVFTDKRVEVDELSWQKNLY